ncbi:bifunctional helix-turn-helix transcriptional regulator/GNAT family N-acetyltransferase [Plastoroseomonas hellenica]|uniref:bifunctional helix-turn-helix transcriptional regulator/GNAT family N-acetyltransferase n=1 Tax=Plastoroseomonas hellenica TaxID=2687306 RepID=UPI001BA69102|nr:bifunctional helix-turn-helix transcriptional regulator/GNAT family N-acetyltransferase [Plastoroseomonas hellenica]MBR0641973.1 MarR family transcriptional regulator [Plastoroseomonas hellenica]
MIPADEVRSFNRFYTREIGLLEAHLPAGDFTLAEARVLYELAQGDGRTAAEIGRGLRMDRAHLSRILARFRARGLLRSRVSPDHGKHLLLALTEAGRAAFAALDHGTRTQVEAILAPLDSEGRERLVAAMQAIRAVLDRDRAAGAAVLLRGLRPGDLGWITHRQAVLYHREYGWDWTYEGLVSGILAGFVAGHDPAREDAWVAERAGVIVGSVFLMQGDDPAVAKLRLLYVEPEARGLGVGRRLVAACIDRARALGYRSLTLWTNDVLVAARRIYQAAGFRLVEQAPHHAFGHDLIGQTWMLDL